MPRRLTLATQADAGFEAHRKTTRRDVFLAGMGRMVPRAELWAVIEPLHPKPRVDGSGLPSVGLERMLHLHFLQQRCALSDPAMEACDAFSYIMAGKPLSGLKSGKCDMVGKYLSPKLYLSYGVGLFTPGEVITLRYLFNRRINFEAQNATTGNRAGINYRYER